MDDPDNELSRLENIINGLEEAGRLEFALLRAITNKFSDARIIGEGGFGTVYKGVLKNGIIAVKKLFDTRTIDEKMFDSEVHSMLLVNHKNIVRFLGYCSDTQGEAMEIGGVRYMGERRKRLLCFEYINNGSLRNYIKDEFRGLEWHERYQIIKGICEGLDHLHREKRIRHMDLKPENILLGDHMIPKIADFGQARLEEKSHTTSKPSFISLGYCAPEYLHHGKMSAKSDIYSLGVIILELVTGSKEDPDVIKVLRRWKHRWNKSSQNTPLLWYRQVVKCLDLAQRCKQKNPLGRPNMWDIMRELNDMDSWSEQIGYAAVSTLDEIFPTLDDMLGIEPLDIHIHFAHCEQTISFTIKITNDTNDYFAFKIATTSLLPFTMQPEQGIVPPRSKHCATVTLEPQDKALLENNCNEEFIVQSIRLDGIPISMNITRDMFSDKSGKVVDEALLAIVFEKPPTSEEPQTDESLGPSSQVHQGSQELLYPTVPDDSRYEDALVLERVLDGSESPAPIKFSTLEFITKNFSDSRVIGRGGIATVYKGILRNGAIAVRKLLDSHMIDDKIFRQEFQTMMTVQHKNIVRFIGYCSHTEEKAFHVGGRIILAEDRKRLCCYEYVSNGNLGNYLTDELRGLEWHTRYEILKGVCEALNHLHGEKHLIHLNLKPSAILLDDQMMPKLSGFSLSRPDTKSRTRSEGRMTSIGYRPPEYIYDGRMSAKSDIYSLGVVIMELVTGAKEEPKTTDVLRKWRHRWKKSGNYMPLWAQQVLKCLELAQICMSRNPIQRPFIWDLIRQLDESDQMSLCMDDLDDILGIEPLELRFSFEFSKQLQRTVQLTNDTDHCIAFRVTTASSLPFRIEPEKGVVPPQSSFAVTVTILLEQNKIREEDIIHRSEILMQSTKVEYGVTAEDMTGETFEEGEAVDEVSLDVMFDTSPLRDEAY